MIDKPATSEPESGENNFAVDMTGISKTYGAVRALSNVSLKVRRGTIHAILGENGAGKSTLIQILSGNLLSDTGTIKVDGVCIDDSNRRALHQDKVAIVHQHLSLAPNLSVSENLFAKKLPIKWGVVDWRKLHCAAGILLRQNAVHIRPEEIVQTLPLAVQQQVEIVRSISGEASIIALDEPTSSLSVRESELLLDRLRELRKQGKTIIIITHHIEDAFSLADDATVIRDGEAVATFALASARPRDVIRMMIGRELTTLPSNRRSSADVLKGDGLVVKDLVSGEQVRDINLHAQRGEVVGIYGLVGAGRSELLQAIFGVTGRSSGSISLNGKLLPSNHSVSMSIRSKMALLSEDRATEGLLRGRSIAENITVTGLRKFGRVILSDKAMGDFARKYIKSVNIKGNADTAVDHLSGGNQQKVLFARWISDEPQLLMVDEPTRGVDVGTKEQIHQQLRSVANSGCVVLVVSSEIPEILRVSDRIYVMADGRLVDHMPISDATSDRLLESASRSTVNVTAKVS